jgi:hypothetical protein
MDINNDSDSSSNDIWNDVENIFDNLHVLKKNVAKKGGNAAKISPEKQVAIKSSWNPQTPSKSPSKNVATSQSSSPSPSKRLISLLSTSPSPSSSSSSDTDDNNDEQLQNLSPDDLVLSSTYTLQVIKQKCSNIIEDYEATKQMKGISSEDFLEQFPGIAKILEERDERLLSMLPDSFKEWMNQHQAPSQNYGRYYFKKKGKKSKKSNDNNNNNNNNNDNNGKEEVSDDDDDKKQQDRWNKMIQFVQSSVQLEIWQKPEVQKLIQKVKSKSSTKYKRKLVKLVYKLQKKEDAKKYHKNGDSDDSDDSDDGNDNDDDISDKELDKEQQRKPFLSAARDISITLRKYLKFILTMEPNLKLEDLKLDIFYSIPRLKGFKIFLSLMPYRPNTRHNQLKYFSILLRSMKSFPNLGVNVQKVAYAYE